MKAGTFKNERCQRSHSTIKGQSETQGHFQLKRLPAPIISCARLGRGDVTLTNNKGFTLIETIVAASLLMVIITTLIPAANLLMSERKAMEQKYTIVNELHSKLQSSLWNNRHPSNFVKEIDGTKATFSFATERDLLKGCVTWTNAQKREDEFCLYGYPYK
ncbi:type II secretion system protein [Lentibacillus lipolyticus]|nr:type II secretion system protein [Lentibacillus lipolyticus]